jgi:hypothetical protein
MAGGSTTALGVFRYRPGIDSRIRSRFAGLHHETVRSRVASNRTGDGIDGGGVSTEKRPHCFLQRGDPETGCPHPRRRGRVQQRGGFHAGNFRQPAGHLRGRRLRFGGTAARSLFPPAQRLETRWLGCRDGFLKQGRAGAFLRACRQGSRTRPRPHPHPWRVDGGIHLACHQVGGAFLLRTLRPLPHARHRTPQHPRQGPRRPGPRHHR